MNNVINLAERRLAKQAKANQQEELKFDNQQPSSDNNIQKTKEQIEQERREHNERVLKNYRIK